MIIAGNKTTTPNNKKYEWNEENSEVQGENGARLTKSESENKVQLIILRGKLIFRGAFFLAVDFSRKMKC